MLRQCSVRAKATLRTPNAIWSGSFLPFICSSNLIQWNATLLTVFYVIIVARDKYMFKLNCR